MYTNPMMCPACNVDAQTSFWDRRIYMNHRLDLHWDRVENCATSIWSGDHGEDYHPRGSNTSVFPELPNKETLFDLVESGLGKCHTCIQGRIPSNLPIEPFLSIKSPWVKKGRQGHYGKIEISVVGMVEQNPECRWQWVTSELFTLALPPALASIFGEKLVIDGWFRLCGERLSRRKKRVLEFKERVAGRMKEGVPRGTKLDIEWSEKFVPAPCHGVTVWGIYAKLVDWKALD